MVNCNFAVDQTSQEDVCSDEKLEIAKLSHKTLDTKLKTPSEVVVDDSLLHKIIVVFEHEY